MRRLFCALLLAACAGPPKEGPPPGGTDAAAQAAAPCRVIAIKRDRLVLNRGSRHDLRHGDDMVVLDGGRVVALVRLTDVGRDMAIGQIDWRRRRPIVGDRAEPYDPR